MISKKYTLADIRAYREETGCGMYTAKHHFEKLERKEVLSDLKLKIENNEVDLKTALLFLIDMEISK